MPFADYSGFADCVSKNSDKDSPEGYCAAIQRTVEGKPIKHEVEDKMQKVRKAGPPGPPPRPGLVWNEQSHRWISQKKHDQQESETRTREASRPPENLHRVDPSQLKDSEVGFYRAHAENVERNANDMVAKYVGDENMDPDFRKRILNYAQTASATRMKLDQEWQRRRGGGVQGKKPNKIPRGYKNEETVKMLSEGRSVVKRVSKILTHLEKGD